MALFLELEDRITAVLAAGMDPSEAQKALETVGGELERLKERLDEAKRRRSES